MSQNINQFSQTPTLGMVDLKIGPTNLMSVEANSTVSTALVPGQAVKMVDSAGGLPKVVACSADADQVLGFVVYSIKDASYAAYSRLEIAMQGTVIYLQAAGAIARGSQVTLDASVAGQVAVLVGSSGDRIVGVALDKAASAGDLIRVYLQLPYTVA